MLAGYGKTEITPPLGTELAGYGYYLGRCAQRVDDPLFARAVALQNDGETFLIVSCDCLGLSHVLSEQVRQALFTRRGVLSSHLMLVSIHTHTGPAMTYHEGCGEVRPEYVKTVPEKIIRACEMALDDLKEVARLQFIDQPLSHPCAYNRAWADNPVDDHARAFYLSRRNAPAIAVASYACHAVCQGASRGISADYPGRICKKLEEEGFLSIYLNGLCGDIDPIRCAPEDRPARLENFAQTVHDAMLGPMNDLPMTAAGGEIEEAVKLIPVGKEDIQRIADQASAQETNPPGGGRVARVWEKEMLERLDLLQPEERFFVRYIRLGGVMIAALPFEGYTKTGMLIREAVGDQRALVLGCADQLMGYLPTEDDIDRHSYAAQDASFLYKRLPARRGEAERIGRDVGKKLNAAR